MSWEASAWVQDHAPVENQGEGCVLYVLANYANADGRHAWPSQRTIAEKAWCSIRSVGRHLANLEKRGVIRRGDQRLVDHMPKGKRPVVWDLNMGLSRKAESDDCQVASGSDNRGGKRSPYPQSSNNGVPANSGDSKSVAPDNRDEVTCQIVQSDLSDWQTNLLNKPFKEPPLTPPTPSKPETEPTAIPERVCSTPVERVSEKPATKPVKKNNTYPEEFEQWYRTYPRHVGKRKAFTAWKTAIKRIDPTTLLARTQEFASHVKAQGTEQRFVPHPTTWLNRDGWDDEIQQPQHRNGFLADLMDQNMPKNLPSRPVGELETSGGVWG